MDRREKESVRCNPRLVILMPGNEEVIHNDILAADIRLL